MKNMFLFSYLIYFIKNNLLNNCDVVFKKAVFYQFDTKYYAFPPLQKQFNVRFSFISCKHILISRNSQNKYLFQPKINV